MKQIDIQSNDSNQRLDKFLLKTFPKLTKSMMYKAIRNKKIKVNRKRCTFDQMLNENDSILLFLPPDVLEVKERDIEFISYELDVVYEDNNLLIVNKPIGLLSQSDSNKMQDTLVSRVQGYLYKKGEYDPKNAQSFAPTICHRLDRNTSGLVIAAKNADALRKVNDAISKRKIHKYYMAYVSGIINKDRFSLTKYIKKENTIAIVSDTEKPGYLKASMDIEVVSRDNKNTWVKVDLHTGRFHQIRVLMSHIGYPLVADKKYGYKGKSKDLRLTAYKLKIDDIGLYLKKNIFEIEL